MGRSPVALYHHYLDDIERYAKNSQRCFTRLVDPALPASAFADPVELQVSQLSKSLLKKFAPEKVDDSLKEVAISNFRKANALCSEWKPTSDPMCAYVLDYMRLQAYRELGDLDWASCLTSMTSGPGASVGSKGKNSFLEKFFLNEFTTTCTSLYGEYLRFMRQKQTWLDAERYRRSRHVTPVVVVSGSNLSTVPKNYSTDRVICTEPSLNMAFQLSLGNRLNSVLKRNYGYDEGLQPKRNRELARKGSINGETSTIDLSLASDTISLKLCEFVLPANWYAAILDCRSPKTNIDGTWEDLHMVSSMGNGFTFPLETYIFSLAVKSLSHLLDIPWDMYSDVGTQYGVFGDDIVCPTPLYEPLCKLLSSLGFIPNKDKSFAFGSFRESCGADWFCGVNVRGVYIKSLSQDTDLYSAVNRLLRWSAVTGIPLPDTIEYLLPKRWRSFNIPYDESDTGGVKALPPRISRAGFQYRKLVFDRKVVSIYRKDVLRPAFDNPFGVILAASIGALSSTGLSRRNRQPRIRVISCATPSWGLHAIHADGTSPISFRRWEEYCYLNLPLK